MQLRIQPGSNQGDQRISGQHQQNCDQEQQRADAGVQGRKDVSTFSAGPATENTDHGAVKRSVDSPQQNQQKPRQHIRVVVSVVSRSNSESGSDHQLSNQPTNFAEQRAEGDDQCDPLE